MNYNGQGGWISLQYTAVDSGRLGDLPVSNQTFTLGQTGGGATSTVNVRTTINLRYRTSPVLSVPAAGAIPYQTEVPALALSSDELFVLVNYQGQNVWVYRQYVEEASGSLSQFTPGAAPALAQENTAPSQEEGAAPAAVTSSNNSPFGVFIAYEGSSEVHAWHTQLPPWMQAVSADSAQLIAYVTENQYLVQRCWFDEEVSPGQFVDIGVVDLMGVRFDVRLVDAASTMQLDTRSFSREVEGCPWGEYPFSSDYGVLLPGLPYIEEALDWFQGYLNG